MQVAFYYRVSGEINRVECKFTNYGSDFMLDSDGIQHLTTNLSVGLMSPINSIILSGE